MKKIKTTKKIMPFLLAALIIFTFSFSVFAAKTVTFTTYNAEVFAGDEFSVDIFISDNSLLKTATLIVSYDERQMTFLDLNVGAIVTSGSDAVSFKDVKGTSGDSFVQIEYSDSSASLSSAGKLFSLTFAANDTAKGQTDIKLSAKGDKIDTLSGTVTPKFNNSVINIINNSVETTPPTEEESSSDVSESAQASSTQNTEQNNTNEVTTQNSQTVGGKNDKKTNSAAVFAVLAVLAVVAVLLVSFDLNGKNKKKRKNKRKKKSRK